MLQTRIEAAVVSTSTEVLVQGSQQRHRQTRHVQKNGRDQFTRQSNITYRKGNKVNVLRKVGDWRPAKRVYDAV